MNTKYCAMKLGTKVAYIVPEALILLMIVQEAKRTSY